jgi:hypothetical protein
MTETKIDKPMALGLFYSYANQAKVIDSRPNGEMRSIIFDCSDIIGDRIVIDVDDIYSESLARKTARRKLARKLISIYA